MGISIECISEPERFLQLQKTWDDLVEHCGCNNLYQTFDWSYTWWKHFGRDKKLLVLVAKDETGGIMGIAPLTIIRSRIFQVPFRLLQFIGVAVSAPPSDYFDLIIADRSREECVQAMVSYMHECSGMWDILLLQNFPEWSLNYPLLKDKLNTFFDVYETPSSKRRKIKDEICPYVPINSTWDAYYHALGRNLRENCRKKARRLARIGQVEYNRVASLEKVDPSLRQFIDLHIKQWGRTGTPSQFRNESVREFYREIAHLHFAKGNLDLSFIELDGKPIAMHFGFRYKGKFYYRYIAQDTAYNYYSPGELLIMESVQDAFRNDMREFDFMNGDEAYKFKWTNQVRTNKQIRAYKRTPSGYLASVWVERIRRCMSGAVLLRKLKRALAT